MGADSFADQLAVIDSYEQRLFGDAMKPLNLETSACEAAVLEAASGAFLQAADFDVGMTRNEMGEYISDTLSAGCSSGAAERGMDIVQQAENNGMAYGW